MTSQSKDRGNSGKSKATRDKREATGNNGDGAEIEETNGRQREATAMEPKARRGNQQEAKATGGKGRIVGHEGHMHSNLDLRYL